MAVSLRQSKHLTATSSGSGSLSLDFDSLPLSGSMVVVLAYVYQGSLALGTGAATDNQSNSYTRDASQIVTATANWGVGIYRCFSIGSPSGTFTVSLAGGGSGTIYGAFSILEFTHDGAMSLDGATTAEQTTSTTTPAVTRTVAAASKLAVAVVSWLNNKTTVSVSSGWTQVGETLLNNFQPGETDYQIATIGTGDLTATWTLDTADVATDAIAVYKEASGATAYEGSATLGVGAAASAASTTAQAVTAPLALVAGVVANQQAGGGAVARVQVKATTGTGFTEAGGSHQLSFDTLPSAGRAVVVAVQGYRTGLTFGTTGVVTDNQGNTYTRARQITQSTFGCAIYFCASIGTPTGTFTVTIAPGGSGTFYGGAAISEYSYGGTFVLVDSEANYSETTTTTPSVSKSMNASRLQVAVLSGVQTKTSITAGTLSPTWTQDSEVLSYSTNPGEIVSRVSSIAAGTFTAEWTTDPTDIFCAIVAVFNDGGGGGASYTASAVLAVASDLAASRMTGTPFPKGRTITADVFRLLTSPTHIWGGPEVPAEDAGNTGDGYFRATGSLLIKTADGWVDYAPVWQRTGGIISPLNLTDAVKIPGIVTVGSHILPDTGYLSNLGSLQKKFLQLHVAEMWAETLVAQNTLATIGGRILVGPTNALAVDLAAAATSITVKYNNFANGDRVYLEANGQVEWLAVTSSASGSAGAYVYTVTRDLDGSGANDWVAGDAVFSTGQTGAGYIDLYSVRSLRSASHLGPTIVGNVRTGTTYSDLSERWAIGNLDGLYGYSGANYGAAFGIPTGAWVKIDPTNGIRIGHNATTKIELTAAGVAKLIGIEAMSVVLGSDGYIRQGQTAYDTGTGFWIGDVSSTPKLSIGSSTSKLTWDGSVLQVTALSFGGSASVAGAWFGGSDIWLGAPYTGGGDKLFSIGVGSMTNNDSLDIGYVATESANSLAPHSGSTWNLARSDRRFSKAYIQDLYAATGASFRSGSDVAGTANSGTGETTIATVTVAAATLGVNGQALRITAFGTFAANTNNKTVKLKIGGTTIVDTTAQAFNGNGYHIELTFIRTGASAEYVSGFYAVPSGSSYNRVGPTSQSLDTTASITILVTGQSGTGSNDIVSRGLLVEAVR